MEFLWAWLILTVLFVFCWSRLPDGCFDDHKTQRWQEKILANINAPTEIFVTDRGFQERRNGATIDRLEPVGLTEET